MLIPATAVGALRCPTCNKIDFYVLSLFAFAGSKTLSLNCSCGTPLLTLGTRDRQNFWVQVHCAICEEKHLFYHRRQDFWGNNQLVELNCEETGLATGFIGSKARVRESVRNQDRSLAEMAADLGFTDYFEDPESMYEVLDTLYSLAEKGHLNCQCGNQNIEIEIFADRLELHCEYCSIVGLLMVGDENAVQRMKRAKEVKLTTNGLQVRERRKPSPRRSKTKKGPG